MDSEPISTLPTSVPSCPTHTSPTVPASEPSVPTSAVPISDVSNPMLPSSTAPTSPALPPSVVETTPESVVGNVAGNGALPENAMTSATGPITPSALTALTPGMGAEELEAEEEEYTESSATLGSTSSGRKRLFSKELRCMMYGFGDDQNPYTESVDLLEDLVIEFITDTTHKGMEIGRTGRVQVEDIVFLVRKDPRKYARVKDLLTMNEELKKARKAFDEVKYVGE